MNTDLSKMSELQFKTRIIKILAGFEKSIEDTRESFVVEIKELKCSQANIKNAITETQSQMEDIKTRMNEAEEQISEIEDKITENKGKRKKRHPNW